MKDKATKLGRPRLPYNTDGRLYMRIPANMVAPCREAVGAMCEAGITINELISITAIQFLLWCAERIQRPDGDLLSPQRVIAQFPEYDTFAVLDDQGRYVEDKYFTAQEVYAFWAKNRMKNAAPPAP
jgi:hypothetical protein